MSPFEMKIASGERATSTLSLLEENKERTETDESEPVLLITIT